LIRECLTGGASYKNNESHQRKERAGGEEFPGRHLGGVAGGALGEELRNTSNLFPVQCSPSNFVFLYFDLKFLVLVS
jgi:hypothetical protein